MDDYPTHLAPEMSEGGGILTPFDEWWHKTKEHFPNVPEIIAEDWLHRHWGQSPHSWLQSRNYDFLLEDLHRDHLPLILSGTSEFEPGGQKAMQHGMYLCGEHPEHQFPSEPLWLVRYMLKSQTFPTPITVLDNRDGHIGYSEYPLWVKNRIPTGLILIEGHKRHEIGLYLRSIGKLRSQLPICRMTLRK
ncbi:MAG: hypothetical protein AAGG45_02880 [Pseudomonadota bacterium]